MTIITRLYRCLLALAGIIGVTIQIHNSGWGMLLYYTVLSNLLVILCLLSILISDFRSYSLSGRTHFLRLKGGVTMAILITGIIYHFLLAPLAKPDHYWTLQNFLVHYIVPWGMVLDTLLFDVKTSYRLREPFYWTLVPMTYFAFALLNGLVLKLPIPGAVDSPFAYFFINVNRYGWSQVLINVVVIGIAYVATGHVLYLLKRYIGPQSIDKL